MRFWPRNYGQAVRASMLSGCRIVEAGSTGDGSDIFVTARTVAGEIILLIVATNEEMSFADLSEINPSWKKFVEKRNQCLPGGGAFQEFGTLSADAGLVMNITLANVVRWLAELPDLVPCWLVETIFMRLSSPTGEPGSLSH